MAVCKRICCYFNTPSHYRKAIYKMLDSEYDCDWCFEKKDIPGINQFDESELHRVKRLRIISIGSFFWVRGFLRLLWQDYDIYLMLGETRNLSLFVFCILKIFFFHHKRIYFWTHGFYGKESKIELLMWKRPFFKLPDGIFTYGDYAKRIMVEDGFDASRLFPIHNSLDYDKQLELRKIAKPSTIYFNYFRNTNPVLIFIGRLMPAKKLNMLVDALAILVKKNEYYNLVFVGDGIERQNLEKRALENNLQSFIWFFGECYDESKNAELIYNADLCIAPGNIGLTAIHSLMFGCPAVSHNDYKRQMPEFEAIHSGETGAFFECGSVDSLADTIHNWFREHKEDRNKVRDACYKEIDSNWNPYFQMKIIRNNLK